MEKNTKGVLYYEEDKGRGPFILRQSGTSNFVTKINTSYYSRFGNPAPSVVFEEGWDNPNLIEFKTLVDAVFAAKQVHDIEGFYISVETKNP